MNKKGFTFIEVLVVATIIGLLAAIGMVSYNAANKKSRDGKRKADIEQIRAALEMYRVDSGEYPADGDVVCGGSIAWSGNTYLSPIPCDPKLGQTGYGYVYDQLTDTTYTISALLEDGSEYEKTQP